MILAGFRLELMWLGIFVIILAGMHTISKLIQSRLEHTNGLPKEERPLLDKFGIGLVCWCGHLEKEHFGYQYSCTVVPPAPWGPSVGCGCEKYKTRRITRVASN